MPSLSGFDLYEIDEDRLKEYLIIERLKNQIKETK